MKESDRDIELVKKVVQRARKKGARQAEAYLEVSQESSVRVRDGEVENLTQATGKGLGLRVFVGSQLGFAYSSDFDPAAIDAIVSRAIDLAKASAKDKRNGLPDLAWLKGRVDAAALELHDPAVEAIDGEWMLASARAMEKVGRAQSPQVKSFEAVEAGRGLSQVCIANSQGLSGAYRASSVYLYSAPVVGDGAQLQTGYWVDARRHLRDLDSPEAVGKKAAERALRMLGARKVKSARVPVVFDPLMAASFVGGLLGALNGDMVFKKSSFLAGKLGQKVASELFTVVDDGLMPRGLGSSPFDGEGLPTRRTALVEKGVLRHFLYDSYTARKAKAQPTGNASRGYASLPSIGPNNLYLEKGLTPPEQLIRGVKSGLYVTAMLGRGANTITGDYSRGANGLWIENGELAYPVQEITVAGNLDEMLLGIDAVGSDLDFRGSIGAPSLRFAELSVSGA